MAEPLTLPTLRVAVLTDGALDGDSRAMRVAAAARSAGYQVTLIGAPPARAAQPGAEIRHVAVGTALGGYRERRPRPGLRWPLAYRSAESYERRTALVAAHRSLLATRAAELDVVHRALPLQAFARTGHAMSAVRLGLRAGWTGLRAAQHRAAVHRRGTPDARLDDLVAGLARLLLGRRAWRRLDPGLLDQEIAYGPVLDSVRPHLIHALGHRALALAIRAALRAEGAGHRIEVVWDAPPGIPAPTRRAAVTDEALLRSYAREADGVVTVGDRLAGELRARHGLSALPAVVRNTPPLTSAPASRDAGVRARCRLGPDVPLLVHAGPVTPDRGPVTVIEALPKLYDLHAAFVVPDPDHPHLAELLDRAAQLGVHARLHVLPYVPVPEVPAFLSSADIGVLPVHQLPHHQTVLATRYYEYAHARLPVVVSDVRAMAAATLEVGNGEVFRARDTADFVRAVGAVLTNPRRYRKAYDRVDVLRQWSWQTESAPLLDLYGRLLGPRR
ncbi:Glycosyltransferase involved in cell wall bisynthesis [Actinacidiphila yanglinensis]|uniref:D-inositol 3-phosphate glycosyltransferase n=1 Tax=Actinacidiphila yanglinensis TaxID=310779 RepID=A0A1H6BN61_9ACTN|nr:glycosyltransferase family 4 protein [Actinacidiphila yanglinensis]SEG61837.1 Glycosyltransferase involved in cell wall bisynthesis [Actinacidiphila yanglinensis]